LATRVKWGAKSVTRSAERQAYWSVRHVCARTPRDPSRCPRTPDFFILLDDQLGDERGPDGEPTSVDFETYELLAIVEKFATGWDDLPEQIPVAPSTAF
jgi:hypothetical protein